MTISPWKYKGPHFLLLILISTCISFDIYADLKETSPDNKNTKEYDFSWLDPEKKIYVLQNRKYQKARRVDLMIGPGITLNNTLVSSYIGYGKLTFFFTEAWGLDLYYKHKFNRQSHAAEHFESNTSYRGLPRQVNYYSGMDIVWAPLYSKVNAFNGIFYIDMGLAAGVAYLQTEADRNLEKGKVTDGAIEQDSTAGVTASAFQKYYISEHFGIRYDLTMLMYQADEVTPISSTAARNKQTIIEWDFTAGLSVLF